MIAVEEGRHECIYKPHLPEEEALNHSPFVFRFTGLIGVCMYQTKGLGMRLSLLASETEPLAYKPLSAVLSPTN